MKRGSIIQFLKFGIIGLSNTLINLILAIIALEFLSIPYPMWYGYQEQISQLPFVNNATIQSENFTILSLPSYFQNSHELYLQTFSDKPILGGYLSRENQASIQTKINIQNYIDENETQEFQKFLIDNKVKYIIIYNNFIPSEEMNNINRTLSSLTIKTEDIGNNYSNIKVYESPLISGFTTNTTMITVPDDFDNTRIIELEYNSS